MDVHVSSGYKIIRTIRVIGDYHHLVFKTSSKLEKTMHIGLCLSAIDHDRSNRSEAREQVLKLKERFGLTSVELVLEGIGRRLAPYPWEWPA